MVCSKFIESPQGCSFVGLLVKDVAPLLRYVISSEGTPSMPHKTVRDWFDMLLNTFSRKRLFVCIYS